MRLFSRFVHHPQVYEFIQNLFGANQIRERLRHHIRALENKTILDVGAGTGIYRTAFQGGHYIALERDPKRVSFLINQRNPTFAVVADAARLCFKDQSLDYVLCAFLAHHLTEADFLSFLREISRVARGKLIFIDPLADSESWLRKRLWKLDQGHYPRTLERLLSHIRSEFEIEHQEQFTIFHRYLLCVATPKSAAVPRSPNENSSSIRQTPTV